MTIDHYLIGKLAECMYGCDLSLQESIAIGCMLRNRVSESLGWADVLAMAFPLTPDNPHDPKFVACLWEAENIYYNRMADTTNGATQFSREPRILATVRVGNLYFFNGASQDTHVVVSSTQAPPDDLPVWDEP